MGSWHVFKAITAKKAGEVKGFFKGKKANKPIDSSLPFDLHIGGSINIDQTPFLIYEDQLKLKSPGAESIIVAYGKINIANSIVHRFYMHAVDDEENRSMIQLVIDQTNDEIEECRLFKSADEVYPETKEDWAFWLEPGEGYIGWHTFEDKDETPYERVWGDSDSDYIEPSEFKETVYLDKFGENITTIDNSAMLYGRWVNEDDETAEYTLICGEEHNDGKALINIMRGIDIIPASIKVNY